MHQKGFSFKLMCKIDRQVIHDDLSMVTVISNFETHSQRVNAMNLSLFLHRVLNKQKRTKFYILMYDQRLELCTKVFLSVTKLGKVECFLSKLSNFNHDS